MSQSKESKAGGEGGASTAGSVLSALADWVTRLTAKRHFGLVLGAVYAVLLVGVGLILHTSGDAASESDFFGPYVKQARHFLQGSILIDQFRGPVYPMALGLASVVPSFLGAGLFETGIVLSALSAGVVLVLLYNILVNLYSAKHALVAVVLVAINPVYVRYSYTTGNDMFFVAFAFAAMYAFLRPDRRWYLLAAASGIAALAYLVRYTGIAIVLAMAVTVLVVNVWGTGWKERLLALLTVATVFFVVITPWGVYCKRETGSFVYNRNFINVALGVYSSERDADRFLAENPDAFESFADVLTHDPVKLLLAIPTRVVRQVHTGVLRVMTFPVAALAFLGIVFMLVRPPGRREIAFYLFGLVYFAVILLVFFSDRFMLYMIPFVAALAACGLFRLADVLRAEPRAHSALAIVFAVVALYGGAISFSYNRTFIGGETRDLKALGRQFRESVPRERRGKSVVERMPHFAYYAGLEHIRLPIVNNQEELLAYMRRNNADYLFFSLTAQRTRGEVATLINPQASHPGLRVVATSPIGVLYEVRPRYRGGD